MHCRDLRTRLCTAVCCSVLQCVAVCGSVLPCVAVCCVLQCTCSFWYIHVSFSGNKYCNPDVRLKYMYSVISVISVKLESLPANIQMWGICNTLQLQPVRGQLECDLCNTLQLQPVRGQLECDLCHSCAAYVYFLPIMCGIYVHVSKIAIYM